jgi:hypothetical protein
MRAIRSTTMFGALKLESVSLSLIIWRKKYISLFGFIFASIQELQTVKIKADNRCAIYLTNN